MDSTNKDQLLPEIIVISDDETPQVPINTPTKKVSFPFIPD